MAIDEEDIEKINEIVHKAIGTREKRFEEKLGKKMDELFGTKFEELRTLIAESDNDDDDEGKSKKPPNEGGEPANGSPSKLSPEVEAALKQAQKDAKEAKDLAEKWKKEAEAERIAKMQTEELTALTQGLTGRVKPALLDMVVKQLHGNIVRDPESKTILWKNSDGDHLPLKDGLDSWCKSDAGKEVAPPRDIRGTGSQGGSSGGLQKGQAMTLDQLGDILTGGR